MLAWLRHAFAVEPPGPAVPSEAERAALDRLCGQVHRKGLVAPALIFLESARPLGFLASQGLQFCGPLASLVLPAEDYQLCAQFLERRGAVDYLCRRLEELSASDA